MQQTSHPRLLLSVCIASSILLTPTVPAGEALPPTENSPPTVVSLPYGWPFLPPKAMEPRGGSTQGAEVTLATTPSAEWTALQDESLSPVEKDRRAILALAGSYRVSFQFIETMGVAAGYHPPRPYFSWGTELVHVLQQSQHTVSLQHTLVMFFGQQDGSTSEPMVMKHWRQDWNYQDRDLHTYRGNQTWTRKTLSDDAVQGRWTQAVYQVDDSPRYETIGRWNHTGGVSRWTSDDAWRPLPRREFSVRDDYHVLAGSHTITVTPTGWVHTQDNRKLSVPVGEDRVRCVACETGINRYERITMPDLGSPANTYWAKTGDYWREVRAMWAEVYQAHDHFKLEKQANGTKLYQEHFGYADQVGESEHYDAKAGRDHARTTIGKFLVERAVAE